MTFSTVIGRGVAACVLLASLGTPLWAQGQYFPLAFSRAKVEQGAQNRLLLKPAVK